MKKFTLENDHIKFSFLDYGATITSLFFKKQDLETILSYDNKSDYLKDEMSLGSSLIGPYAGRIENAKYTIDERITELDKNFKDHSIHGGFKGISKSIFNVTITENVATLTLTYQSLSIKMLFTLEENRLKQEVFATTLEPTLFNPTNHAYFTLGSKSCLDYVVNLNCDYMYILNEDSMPCKKVEMKDTTFDILNGKDALETIANSQFELTKHVDHPFHLTSNHITINNPSNHITFNIKTNAEFGVVYCGNYMGECDMKINAKAPTDHMGICIETQNIPNGINMENESSSILYPEEEFYYFNEYYIS